MRCCCIEAGSTTCVQTATSSGWDPWSPWRRSPTGPTACSRVSRSKWATATVGGNLCAAAGVGSQRGDLGAPLIALGARVRSAGRGGERTEAVEDFLAGDRSRRLVLEIEIDRPTGAWSAQTLRRRHAHSYAIANVAACSSGDVIRVGVSGIGPAAVRCRSVEQSRNADEVSKDVDPVDDAVATADYRRRMLVVLVRRALDELGSS